MIPRTSLLGLVAAGAIAACSGQQQQQANSPTYGAMNAQGPQTDQAMSSDSNEVPSSGNSAVSPRSTVDRPGAIGVTGPPGPPASTPGASNVTVANANPNYGAPSTTGVTNEQPAANPEDISSLNDAQLSELVVGIHESEIKQGELAESNASSPAVKKLAAHMVGAHRSLLANDRTVLARNRISPSTSAMSEQMKGDSEGQLATLQSLRGKDFDTAYLDNMVRGHKKALHLLDRIIGEVKSADLKSDLEAERTHIEEHLREAQRTRDMQAAQVTTASPATSGDMNRTHSQDFSDGGTK